MIKIKVHQKIHHDKLGSVSGMQELVNSSKNKNKKT
jgi:hypothetical protein